MSKNIENKIENKIDIEQKLGELEKNNIDYQYEKLSFLFSETPTENIWILLENINDIISNDINIQKKWDFLKTLEKIKIT